MTYRVDYVLALAEERNLTRAAQKLYISQPTLTKYITRLEQDLGVQLFDRTVQPIRITRAGQVFIEEMQKIQTRETNLRTRLKAISRDAESFSIGIPTIRAEYVLPGVLPGFLEKYPHVSVSTDPRIESTIEGAVAAGELDVAIGALTLAYDELEYTFLKEDEVLPCPVSRRLRGRSRLRGCWTTACCMTNGSCCRARAADSTARPC